MANFEFLNTYAPNETCTIYVQIQLKVHVKQYDNNFVLNPAVLAGCKI